MQVRFYFDPLCPWCWVTSHWLSDEVAPHRDIQIDYRPISLKVRNEHKELDEAYKRFLPAMERSFGLLRIVEALRADGHEDQVHDVYEAFGRHFHHDDDGLTFDVAEALTAAGVDTAYAAALDDATWDDAVRASTSEAEAIAGDDVGTPIIAIERDGQWVGYFGPVIPSVVTGDAALRLWDGLAALMETDGFFELKRTRDTDLDLSSVRLR
jgi:2-hydroxychromene-2-carboxylate isomerase